MKRLIATACTIILSLIGSFGAKAWNNQNASNTEQSTNIVKQYDATADTKEQSNLPTKIEATVANKIPKVNQTNQDMVTPQIVKDKNTVDDIDKNNNNNQPSVASSKSTDKQATPLQTEKKYNDNASVKEVAARANNNTKNGQVIIYKNVDLSQCKSKYEIINKLQQNGVTGINSSNIQNIASLQDILSKLQINGTGNDSVIKPQPVVTPKPTAKPTPKPTMVPAPTAKPTPVPSNTTSTGMSSYASQVLQLVNKERAKAGLSALTTTSSLSSAANKRAKETSQSFSHTRPNGTSCFTVLKEFNISYRASGENIAYGQRTPQEVVTGWMNSPGHRANILNSNFNKIGIGVYQASNGTIYWSQLFTD